MLDYHQSTSGQPRMVYAFRFVTLNDIDASLDEAVPLFSDDDKHDDDHQDEVYHHEEDDNAQKTRHDHHDHRPQLYVHHNAFLKVLGATLDVDITNVTPILYDRQGNLMDPNA